MKILETDQEKCCSVLTALLVSKPLSFLSPSSGMSLPLSGKQVTCGQARRKVCFRTKEHLRTATFHCNKVENRYAVC